MDLAFEYFAPRTLLEALDLAQQYGDGAFAMTGLKFGSEP